jgi:hypothetical protein
MPNNTHKFTSWPHPLHAWAPPNSRQTSKKLQNPFYFTCIPCVSSSTGKLSQYPCPEFNVAALKDIMCYHRHHHRHNITVPFPFFFYFAPTSHPPQVHPFSVSLPYSSSLISFHFCFGGLQNRKGNLHAL